MQAGSPIATCYCTKGYPLQHATALNLDNYLESRVRLCTCPEGASTFPFPLPAALVQCATKSPPPLCQGQWPAGSVCVLEGAHRAVLLHANVHDVMTLTGVMACVYVCTIITWRLCLCICANVAYNVHPSVRSRACVLAC